MAREFEVVREVELNATPEEVWDAVASNEGNEGWLFPSAPIEQRVGATSDDGSKVTACDRPRHFAVRTEGEGGWFNAVEFTIEAREGGTTTLRYVHSGVFTDDWDDQYDAVNQHTDFYLHTLGQYLEHFAGRRATYIGDGPGGLMAPMTSSSADGFDTLKRALGVDAAAAGDAIRARGAQPLDGVVDYAHGNFLGIRTADALYRFFGRNAFGGPVALAIHHFGDGVDAEATKRAWQDWLNGVYV